MLQSPALGAQTIPARQEAPLFPGRGTATELMRAQREPAQLRQSNLREIE